jgi:hypothetical protein
MREDEEAGLAVDPTRLDDPPIGVTADTDALEELARLLYGGRGAEEEGYRCLVCSAGGA